MTEKLRATAIALFPEGMDPANCLEVIERLKTDRGLAGFQTILRETILSDGSKRSYLKVFKVVPRDELGNGWVVDLTDRLFGAGFEDVAWRATRIGSDIDEENTTGSFPVELFRAVLEDDLDLP